MKRKLSRKTKNNLLVIFFALLALFVSLMPVVADAEIETRLMVNALGFDVTDEGVKLSATTINGGDNDVVTGEGIMVTDALNDLGNKYGRNVELGHCGLIVTGENVSKNDLVTFLLGFISDGKINTGCAVVAVRGEAYDFIKDAVLLNKTTFGGASGFVGYTNHNTGVSVPSLLKVAQDLKSKSGVSMLPVLRITEKKEESGSSGNSSSGEEGQRGGSNDARKTTEVLPPKSVRIITDVPYELPEDLAEGLVWVSDSAKGGLVRAQMQVTEQEYSVPAYIENSNNNIKAEFCNGTPTVTLSVDARLTFAQRYAMLSVVEAGADLYALMDGMNDAFVQSVKGKLSALVEVSKVDDFLGIKTKLHRADSQKYAEWSGDLTSVKVVFDVKVRCV